MNTEPHSLKKYSSGASTAGSSNEIELSIDINCDLGEGMTTDASIMPYISSANIACGYHAGNEQTIWQTIELAVRHNVSIGAHISFFDKENFGRTEMNLPSAELYDLVTQQLIVMNEFVDSFDVHLHHVKPHGALYNMSAKDEEIATTIARAIKDFDENIILVGLCGSHSISAAKAAGLKTAGEAFADRSYQDNGHLTPRSTVGALIEDSEWLIQQVLQVVKKKTVTSLSGKEISLSADTICIHGDGHHAVDFAKAIHHNLKQNNIAIKAF